VTRADSDAAAPGSGPRVVFVAGMSGSGKTTAMAALEDQRFYCVDNLPPQLVGQFLALCRKADPPIERIALAVDTRSEAFLEQLPEVLRELRATSARGELLFLECSKQVLQKRYRETRRVHPLSPTGSVEEGIERERKLLEDVARLADHVIDTTPLNVHQLRDAVGAWVGDRRTRTVVNLLSFGFRYGTPGDIELLFDARFLPNPYFEPGMRERTGREDDVAGYVLRSPTGKELMERLEDFLGFLLPLYDREGKSYITIGVGCTGGRHRSVAIVEALAAHLGDGEREVTVEHRDLEK